MIWHESVKIGVIGTYNSGKTVFLTSLLNHLLHHSSDKFQLKGSEDICIKKTEFLETDGPYSPFPYEAYRDALVRQGKWPAKTLCSSQIKLDLKLSSGFQKNYELTLFDFPGEALADASMALLDYPSWSKATLGSIQDHETERQAASDYLSLLQQPNHLNEASLLKSYKIYLAKKRKAFRPLIQPSSFILSEESGLISSQLEVEAMIQNRFLGSRSSEFIPLSEKMIEQNSELAKRMQQHYEKYRSEKVLPLFKELATCDSLLILNDLPTMLNAGSDMCNDTIEMVKACMGFCQPGKNAVESLYLMSQIPRLYRQSTEMIAKTPILGTISQYLLGKKSPLDVVTSALDHWLGVKKIKRLVIAASKCDLVHESDRDKLQPLLKELFLSTANAHEGLDLVWSNLSAAVATRSSVEHHALLGELESASQPGEQLVKVSQLPEHWPHQWNAGEYSFPDFKPKCFPGLKVQSPEHYNMDKVFNHLIGWSE
jgi:predicted YcjX-like family ATPase